MEWILILFIYAGALARGDSVAIESVPGFKTQQSCQAAAQQVEKFTQGTAKNIRFACVQK